MKARLASVAFMFLSFVLLSHHSLSAQDKYLFLEIGGSGGLGSINYERFFPPKIRNHTGWDGDDGVSPFRWTWRSGFSLSPIDRNNGWVIIFPNMFNLIYGDNNSSHKFEVGAGFAPSITTKGAFFIKSPLSVGYRYQRQNKPLFFRVNYTPIVAWLLDFQWQHWAGISVGYRFALKNPS